MRRTLIASVLCLVLGASACSGDEEDGAPEARQAASAAEALDWTTEDLPGVGLTVSYPAGWTRSAGPLLPGLADPQELVAFSTFSVRAGGENCAHMPENALQDMGSQDALVVVEERLGDHASASATLADYPRRPERFGPGNGYRSEAAECLDRPKQFFDRFIPFSDSGRRFYAYVAFGAETPPSVRTQAWTILDRLDVEPAG